MQYYYQCCDAADQAQDSEQDVQGSVRVDPDDIDIQELINNIELPDVLLTPGKRAQLDHADRAIDAGFCLGIFSKDEKTLMHIQGEGGRGKSRVIKKITKLMAAHEQAHKL
jgi:hypothetical protein